jgi:hypothetical protein
MCDTYTCERSSLYIRDKPIPWLERILHKDYDCKSSVAKKKKKMLVVILKELVAKTN